MGRIPLFPSNSTKALEVILWLATESPGIDVYHLVKAVYFADKEHVAAYGRPICGGTYDAATYGPLARVVHGLLRGSAIDILALGGNGDLPFKVDGRTHCVTASRGPNNRKLSTSEAIALTHGLEHVKGRSFNDIYRETHEDPAYINANGGRMDYRDFLPEDLEDRESKAQDILESAEYTYI